MQTTKKDIVLPQGGVLEVELTDQFLDIVADHFMVQDRSSVTDDHLRMYIWGAFKNAIDKAERESP